MRRKGLDKHNGIYQKRTIYTHPRPSWFIRFVVFLWCYVV